MRKCLGTLAILLIISNMALGFICSRLPPHTFAPKSPVDENIALFIHGNPQTYMLGAEYKITLDAFNGARFIRFMLVLENENGKMNYNDDLGKFGIMDDVETRFSANCYNTMESTNTNPKTHIEVKWIAPTTPGNGCILIRATVLQNRDVWFMDDGGLTRQICEEIVDDIESKTIDEENVPCCACDEASYEITFEGNWSRNLHPKDFPPQGWITRFSDILGASHTSDYRFWEYGHLATQGMRELAEHGSLRLLQSEFNQHFKEGKIRTIIRARGPAFPNLNGQSISSIRVDAQHHMLSLASKIEPSPDWVVGISGLELCLTNCTWLDEKVLKLYPWDIGTDGGPSYMSPDQPQVPPDVIRRIRHDSPNDPRSPFFSEEGEPMKPLATLTIRRKKLYVKNCDDEDSRQSELPRECATHPFSAWSECTAACGQGTQWRRRVYKQPEMAKLYNCDALTKNYLERICFGKNCNYADNNNNNNIEEFSRQNSFDVEEEEGNCELTRWSEWSPCSKTCGEGKMLRRRQYMNAESEEKCQSQRMPKLLQYKKCVGQNCLTHMPIASDEMENDKNNNNNNEYSSDNGSENQILHNSNNYVTGFSNRNEHDMEADEDTQFDMNEKQEDEHTEHDLEEQEHVDQTVNESLDNRFDRNHQHQSLDKRRLENNYNINKNRGSWRNKDANDNISGNEIEYEEEREHEQQEDDNDKNAISQFEDREEDETESYRKNNKWHRKQSEIVLFCFEQLQVFSCEDITVTGNYWFYNYCSDECMLFAVDNCDMNRNKFKSLEDCEATCQKPVYNKLLRLKQRQDCRQRQLYNAIETRI